ncbi:hypothetical protein DFH07DRAFT_936395 [Mycena maculata]|uniref:Uncharacterized protein n=1 Tax=Mycena maculata TaxID=230809 RepID=A0AAD7K7G8_9AGAR|nr:hypothetical protein DFH07DRAFT_936395 [Mycena maculata]
MTFQLNQLGKERVEDMLLKYCDLAGRVSLALDPELVLDSDIDETTLDSLKTEIESLKERTEKNEMQALLARFDELNKIRDGFIVMSEQLQSRREALDPNHDPDFPSAVSFPARRNASQPAQAGSSRTNPGQGIGSTSSRARPSGSDVQQEPASGPQRHTPSSRVHRQATSSPPSRPRLPIPSDSQIFDVAFLPFKYTYSIELPDPALRAVQFRLQRLGLVHQARLPRQGSVQEYLDCQVKSFCEEKQIDLQPAQDSESYATATAWTLMKRKGKKFELKDDMLAPGDFTTAKLMRPTIALPNYLSGDSTHKLLLIAPLFSDLCGAITLPDIETPQMRHRCHVTRVRATIRNERGNCDSDCPQTSSCERSSSSRRESGRTLA